MVYLHSPKVFHSLIVLSRDPDTICNSAGQRQAQYQAQRSSNDVQEQGQCSLDVCCPCDAATWALIAGALTGLQLKNLVDIECIVLEGILLKMLMSAGCSLDAASS